MTRTPATERNHDRPAPAPHPSAVSRWRAILLRTWDRMGTHHVTLVAAGVAFYGLLAIFPAITAVISIWGLILDPHAITQKIAELSAVLPDEARSIIAGQARAIAAGTGAGISLAAIGGILFALFSSMKGMRSLIDGLNLIHGEGERRGFIVLNLLTFVLMLALVLVVIATLGLLIVFPLVVDLLGFASIAATLVGLARWPVLALVAVVGMTVLYRYGPSRRRQAWRHAGRGAIAGTALWIVASAGFSVYLRYFGAYNETYGTLGAVIALLMWFWLSALAILTGAEVEAAIEHHDADGTGAARTGA